MGCRSPKIYSQPYMLTPVPSSVNERYSIIHIADEEHQAYAAVELDCSSEIDCCIVKHSGGFAFLAVGAPALGPFTGPLDIMPWRRVMPYGPEIQGYISEPLLSTLAPILAVKVHYQMPPAFQGRRAPTIRSAPDFPTAAGYQVAAEFPLYGYLRARISILSMTQSLTYKVEGQQYRARSFTTEQSADPVSTDSSAGLRSQLVLDGAGSVERTIAAGVVEALDIIEEPFDTLVVSVKNGAGAATARFMYRAEG